MATSIASYFLHSVVSSLTSCFSFSRSGPTSNISSICLSPMHDSCSCNSEVNPVSLIIKSRTIVVSRDPHERDHVAGVLGTLAPGRSDDISARCCVQCACVFAPTTRWPVVPRILGSSSYRLRSLCPGSLEGWQ